MLVTISCKAKIKKLAPGANRMSCFAQTISDFLAVLLSDCIVKVNLKYKDCKLLLGLWLLITTIILASFSSVIHTLILLDPEFDDIKYVADLEDHKELNVVIFKTTEKNKIRNDKVYELKPVVIESDRLHVIPVVDMMTMDFKQFIIRTLTDPRNVFVGDGSLVNYFYKISSNELNHKIVVSNIRSTVGAYSVQSRRYNESMKYIEKASNFV